VPGWVSIVGQVNTNTNIVSIVRLTNCPGALTNVKMGDGIDEFFKRFLNLFV